MWPQQTHWIIEWFSKLMAMHLRFAPMLALSMSCLDLHTCLFLTWMHHIPMGAFMQPHCFNHICHACHITPMFLDRHKLCLMVSSFNHYLCSALKILRLRTYIWYQHKQITIRWCEGVVANCHVNKIICSTGHMDGGAQVTRMHKRKSLSSLLLWGWF